MLSAITTLAVLGIFWLIGVVTIHTLEESGARIAAALAGARPGEQTAVIVKLPKPRERPVRLQQPLRAAA